MRRRPDPLPPGFTPPQALRFRRGSRRYVPDVVERVRVLIEGTALSEAAVAARTGVGTTTVHEWKKRWGWQRPAGASRSTRTVASGRAGFDRRLREALRRAASLAEREAARFEAAGRPEEAARARALAATASASGARARSDRTVAETVCHVE